MIRFEISLNTDGEPWAPAHGLPAATPEQIQVTLAELLAPYALRSIRALDVAVSVLAPGESPGAHGGG